MQSPTPPTKPTPPTPPSMKTWTGSPSTDTPPPTKTAPQSITPSKVIPAVKEQPTPVPASAAQSTSLPPLAAVSPYNTTSTETTAERSLPISTKSSKTSSSATGFTTFFVLIFIIGIALVAAHWWKNYKQKQRSTVDYSTESSDEIVNLIFSENNFEPAVQAIPKTIAKKSPPQAESAPKTKRTFDVRA